MTIEQKAEYPGQFKTKANGTSGRWKGMKKNIRIFHLLSDQSVYQVLSIFAALSLMADLGGYLGLFLGYSLMQISGPLTLLWRKFR